MSKQVNKRNRNAGNHPSYDKRNMSESAKAKKRAYDTAYGKTDKAKKQRADANRKRRAEQKKGNPKAKVGSKYDVSHKKGGGYTMEDRSKNRGRKGEGGRVKGKRK